ncbi:MAG: cyclodeaminase/cyclohydrolase family protein [Chloroflexota bacterium]
MSQSHSFPELSLRSFSDLLASDAPVPGGGSASAIAASLGASLLAMVARLSQGRERYAPFAGTIQRALVTADAARTRLLELADEDASAYRGLVEARAAARQAGSGQAELATAVREAAREAARVPMAIVRECYAVMDHVDRMAGRSNLGAASDLDVAARLLEAGARGAGANVMVNLPAMGDERLADSMIGELEARTHELVSAVARIASQVRSQGLRPPETA